MNAPAVHALSLCRRASQRAALKVRKILSVSQDPDARRSAARIIASFSATPQQWNYQTADGYKISASPTQRLPAIARIHTLIRLGYPHRASRFLAKLMVEKVRIPRRTTHTLVMALLRTAPDHLDPECKTWSMLPGPRKTLSLSSILARERFASRAIRHVLIASKHMQPRTPEMYSELVRVLLRQGEFFAAASVFQFMVAEYRYRMSIPAILQNPPPKITPEIAKYLEKRCKYLTTENILPDQNILNDICTAISNILRHPQEIERPGTFRTACTALALLALMLKRREIPFANLSMLIKTLFLVNDLLIKVCINDTSYLEPVPLGAFSCTMLKDFVEAFPAKLPFPLESSHPDTPSLDTSDILNTPLDLLTYNTLLNGILDRWKEPLLAMRVYKHMTEIRQPPLVPDEQTPNLFTLYPEKYWTSPQIPIPWSKRL